MSLRLTAYVASKSPEKAQERKLTFLSNNGLFSKKVCYEGCLCENFQQQSCLAFFGLSIVQK